MTRRSLPGSTTALESIAEFNQTGAPFPDKTLPELIDAQARQVPAGLQCSASMTPPLEALRSTTSN